MKTRPRFRNPSTGKKAKPPFETWWCLSVRQLAEYGIFPRQLDNPERRAALISLEGEYGPFHRLGFNNFYVITRYNLSKRYAMAVVELGEMIRRYREENSPT